MAVPLYRSFRNTTRPLLGHVSGDHCLIYYIFDYFSYHLIKLYKFHNFFHIQIDQLVNASFVSFFPLLISFRQLFFCLHSAYDNWSMQKTFFFVHCIVLCELVIYHLFMYVFYNNTVSRKHFFLWITSNNAVNRDGKGC